MIIGKDIVVVGNVPKNLKVGNGSVIIGSTDGKGNTILNRSSVAIGKNAQAGHQSIAIGSGARAGGGDHKVSKLGIFLEFVSSVLTKLWDKYFF